MEWIMFCSSRLSSTLFDLFIFLLWSVWTERNTRVWEGKARSVGDVGLFSTSRLQDYIYHNSCNLDHDRGADREVRWYSPPIGCIKINIDGAFVTASGAGAIGLVLRDSSGNFLVSKGRPVWGSLSAEHAELLACKEALELIIEQSLQPAIVETDSLVIKQQLSSYGVNLSRLGSIYEDIGVLLEALPNVRIVHTRRDANKAAHLMAAHASTTGQALFYSSVHSFLHEVITHELCNH